MNKICVFIPALLITSCHVNDPRPEIHRARVSVEEGDICVTLPGTKNESLSLLSINEIGHGESMMNKEFTMENSPGLSPGNCIDEFGFVFKPGHSYVFSVNTLRIKKDHTITNGNSYSVTFSLWKVNGELQVKDINSL